MRGRRCPPPSKLGGGGLRPPRGGMHAYLCMRQAATPLSSTCPPIMRAHHTCDKYMQPHAHYVSQPHYLLQRQHTTCVHACFAPMHSMLPCMLCTHALHAAACFRACFSALAALHSSSHTCCFEKHCSNRCTRMTTRIVEDSGCVKRWDSNCMTWCPCRCMFGMCDMWDI